MKPVATSGHIDCAILRYRLRIRCPCDIAAPRYHTILCRNARLTHALLAGTDHIHSNSYRLLFCFSIYVSHVQIVKMYLK